MRGVNKSLCPATIIASIMTANMWKNSLKNVESDRNKFFLRNLIRFFLQRNGTYFLNKLRISPTVELTPCMEGHGPPPKKSRGWDCFVDSPVLAI